MQPGKEIGIIPRVCFGGLKWAFGNDVAAGKNIKPVGKNVADAGFVQGAGLKFPVSYG